MHCAQKEPLEPGVARCDPAYLPTLHTYEQMKNATCFKVQCIKGHQKTPGGTWHLGGTWGSHLGTYSPLRAALAPDTQPQLLAA